MTTNLIYIPLDMRDLKPLGGSPGAYTSACV